MNKEKNFVFLTGATGFLGIHILDCIIKKSNFNIFCLIREKTEENAHKKLVKHLNYYFDDDYKYLINKRIFVVKGDITKVNFGLRDDQYQNIGKLVHSIYNTAALVRYYDFWEKIYQSNVESVRNILKFAERFNLNIEHISTLSIFDLGYSNDDIVHDEDEVYIGDNSDTNLYMTSKLVSEKLYNNSKLYNKKVKIYRVGNISERYTDGKFQYNINDNMIHLIIKAFLELRIMPLAGLERNLEFTPVDMCAAAIVELSFTKNENKVYHIYNNNFIKVKDICGVAEELNYKFEYVDFKDMKTFIAYVRQINKITTDRFAYIRYYKNQLNMYGKKIKISSNKTQKILNKCGFIWPIMNEEYIKKVLINTINMV